MEPSDFQERNMEFIEEMASDAELQELTARWYERAAGYEYSYHFEWLGRPIIQYPQDIVAMQEIIWDVKPDLIIETGVARGGSIVFYSSLLELIGGDGEVVGIEIDHRDYNREALEDHPMQHRFRVREGSSTDEVIVAEVAEMADAADTVLVTLDSHHGHDHVLRELELYSPLVTEGSYLVVFDGIVEEMPPEVTDGKPWGPGDNPKTAVEEFLGKTDRFEIDEGIENKLLITVAPSGYLKCVSSDSND